MLAYLALLGCAVAGFSGMPPYAIAACAIALASISYAEQASLYRRGQSLGHARVVEFVVLKSFFNALMASGAAYGGGLLLRLL